MNGHVYGPTLLIVIGGMTVRIKSKRQKVKVGTRPQIIYIKFNVMRANKNEKETSKDKAQHK